MRLLIFLLLTTSTTFLRAEVNNVVTLGVPGPAGRIELTLAEVQDIDGPEGLTQNPVTLLLWNRGDALVQGHLLWDRGASGHAVDISGLRLEGNSLSGEVKPWYLIHPPFPMTAKLSVDLAAGSGTFKASVAGNRKARQYVEGEVRAARIAPADFSNRNAVNPDLGWPLWCGPNLNWSATETNDELIDSLRDARLVWVSETRIPSMLGDITRFFSPVKKGHRTVVSGGAQSPLVADGKVFVSYHVASGKVIDEEKMKEHAELLAKIEELETPDRVAYERTRWAVGADDEVACFDAATGALLWKSTFPGAGMHWEGHKLGPGNMTGVVAGRRLIVLGSTCRLYCLDTQTGKLLWSVSEGERHQWMEGMRKKCLEDGTMFNHGNRQDYAALGLVDDKLVINPYEISGLVARSVDDGSLVWKAPGTHRGGTKGKPLPIVWEKGEHRQLITRSDSHLHGLDALTGKELWRLPVKADVPDSLVKAPSSAAIEKFTGASEVSHVLAGDVILLKVDNPAAYTKENYVVLGQVKGYRGEEDLVALQLRVDGPPTELWRAPTPGGSHYLVPVVWRDRVLMRGADVTIHRISNGELLYRGDAVPARGGNGQYAWAANGRFFLQNDGKHGFQKIALIDAVRPAETSFWSPPHKSDTGYGPGVAHPLVDGRLFIRGRSALYCYDLRQR